MSRRKSGCVRSLRLARATVSDRLSVGGLSSGSGLWPLTMEDSRASSSLYIRTYEAFFWISQSSTVVVVCSKRSPLLLLPRSTRERTFVTSEKTTDTFGFSRLSAARVSSQKRHVHLLDIEEQGDIFIQRPWGITASKAIPSQEGNRPLRLLHSAIIITIITKTTITYTTRGTMEGIHRLKVIARRPPLGTDPTMRVPENGKSHLSSTGEGGWCTRASF